MSVTSAPRPTTAGPSGTLLRRAGLALAGSWVLAVVLTVAGWWAPDRGLGAPEEVAHVLSLAVNGTWGFLGAAVAVYLTGVFVGRRGQRPVQVRLRWWAAPSDRRSRRLPLVVVAVAVAALMIAVVQQAHRNDAVPDRGTSTTTHR